MIILISKKWAMIFISVFALVVTSFISYEEFFAPNPNSNTAGIKHKKSKILTSSLGFEEILKSPEIHTFTWEQYLQDCGSLKIIHNQYRADNLFAKKYKYRLVEWEGYFQQYGMVVQDFRQHEGALIKMKPTDSTEESSDILLTEIKDRALLGRLKGNEVEAGKKVIMKLRLSFIGDEELPHRAILEELKETAEKATLDEISKFPKFEFKKKPKSRIFKKSKKKDNR